MDHESQMLRKVANVYLGGQTNTWDTTSKATFVDTAHMIVGESGSNAAARAEMRKQGQVQHFELGAEQLDYSTSGFQDDHFRSRTESDRERMAADARLHAFKKKDMQNKHFELGLKKTDYTSLAAASFKWDASASTAESAATKAEASERSRNAQKTNFFMGATPTNYKSEAAAAFTQPPPEDETKAREKLPPGAKTSNITIGLVPVDYTTCYQSANQESMAARAAIGGDLRAKAGGAGLRATNWTLGLDDNKAEGHYTSQTMKDLWHVKVPEGKNVGAAAVRTASAYADRRVIPPAIADDSPEFMATLKSMARPKPRK